MYVYKGERERDREMLSALPLTITETARHFLSSPLHSVLTFRRLHSAAQGSPPPRSPTAGRWGGVGWGVGRCTFPGNGHY